MLHPSYTDLMKLANSEVESGEAPVVNSRYSIVLATSKRARQLIDGAEAYVSSKCPKPLSVAVDELNNSKIRILSEEEAAEIAAKKALKNKDISVVQDKDPNSSDLSDDDLNDDLSDSNSDLNDILSGDTLNDDSDDNLSDSTLSGNDIDNEVISILEEA